MSWKFLATRLVRGSVVSPPQADDKDRGDPQAVSLRAGLWSVRIVLEVDQVRGLVLA